jgi:membrane-associated protein
MWLLAMEIGSNVAAKGSGVGRLAIFSNWLERISTSPYFYAVIFGVALLDSVFPVVPSETAVILGGIAAGQGKLSLPLVILTGACGAFCGDNIAYQIGARFGGWIERRSNRTEKGRKRLLWAKTQLEKRGGSLLVTARFIPGGRTIVTLASGITSQPLRRFRLFVALASMIWATYASVLGYYFGDRFKDDHNKALLLAFAAAISVTVLLEVVRWVRHRGKPDDH